MPTYIHTYILTLTYRNKYLHTYTHTQNGYRISARVSDLATSDKTYCCFLGGFVLGKVTSLDLERHELLPFATPHWNRIRPNRRAPYE